MKTPDKELDNLLKQLRIDRREAQKIADEIRIGQELLSRQSEPSLSPALMARIEQTIKSNLRQRTTINNRGRRIAFVAAAIAVAVLASSLFWPGGNHRPTDTIAVLATQNGIDPFDNELNLWDLALTQGDDDEIDELVITEVSSLWDEADNGPDNIFGKAQDYENFS